MTVDPRQNVFIALDLPTVAEAEALIERLGDEGQAYKIGYQLAFAGGLDLSRRLVRAGKRVFLDMKLHDIGNTVEHGIAQIADLGITYATVHAYPQTMTAAMRGQKGSSLKVLAVTVMTSYDDSDMVEAGYSLSVEALVAKRAMQARDLGVNGLVLSPHELVATRKLVGPDMHLVTPGVRPAGSAVGDQKRVMTPLQAMQAGADALVIGRPITEHADPVLAAREIAQSLTTN